MTDLMKTLDKILSMPAKLNKMLIMTYKFDQ